MRLDGDVTRQVGLIYLDGLGKGPRATWRKHVKTWAQIVVDGQAILKHPWPQAIHDGHMESAARSSSDRLCRSNFRHEVNSCGAAEFSAIGQNVGRDVKSSHPTSNDRRKHTRTRSYSVALIIWNLSHPHQTAVFLVRFEITQKNWRLMFRGAIHFSKKISDGTCYGCQRPLCEVESPFCL